MFHVIYIAVGNYNLLYAFVVVVVLIIAVVGGSILASSGLMVVSRTREYSEKIRVISYQQLIHKQHGTSKL